MVRKVFGAGAVVLTPGPLPLSLYQSTILLVRIMACVHPNRLRTSPAPTSHEVNWVMTSARRLGKHNPINHEAVNRVWKDTSKSDSQAYILRKRTQIPCWKFSPDARVLIMVHRNLDWRAKVIRACQVSAAHSSTNM